MGSQSRTRPSDYAQHRKTEQIVFRTKVKVTQLCPTLCDPVDYSPPGSSVHGILPAWILEWVAIPFSRGSSQPRDQTQVFCIAGRFFTVWATREATCHVAAFSEDLLSTGWKSFHMVPWKDQRTDSRTPHGYQNPLMPGSHTWSSMSTVPCVWVQPSRLCSALVFNEKKLFIRGPALFKFRLFSSSFPHRLSMNAHSSLKTRKGYI